MPHTKVLQILAYYPPHKGGLESHAMQWAKYFTKSGHGICQNIVLSVGQEPMLAEARNGKRQAIRSHEHILIGYYDDNGIPNLVMPAFEIITNFPFPKFWNKNFWRVLKAAKQYNPDIVLTRTRFFVSSLLGGFWARSKRKKWVHVEHGSDYVQVSSKLTNAVAYVYDKLFGMIIFRLAHRLVGVSDACRQFVQNKFVKRNISVIVRGVEKDDFENMPKTEDLQEKFPNKLIVGYVGRLYAWKNVQGLIEAVYNLPKEEKEKLQLVIVGEGEDYNTLVNMPQAKDVYFTGGVNHKEAISYQSQFHIYVHSSNPGGGLATTLMQAMALGCFIVATPYEGANELLEDQVNGIMVPDASVASLKQGVQNAIAQYDQKKDDFARANKEIVQEELNWDKNIEKYNKLFRELV